MHNPRSKEGRKFYIKLFNKNKGLYEKFLELYDRAVKADTPYPAEMAMVDFRELYIRTPEGWEAK